MSDKYIDFLDIPLPPPTKMSNRNYYLYTKSSNNVYTIIISISTFILIVMYLTIVRLDTLYLFNSTINYC